MHAKITTTIDVDPQIENMTGRFGGGDSTILSDKLQAIANIQVDDF